MSMPQNQKEQMIQDQIRQVYEQTQQWLQHATDPHTTLMFIDAQLRTLQYILEFATKLWNCPVAAREASDLIASLYNIRPTYQAWADRTPKPPMQGSVSPSLSGEWLRMVQDYAKKNEELRDRSMNNYLGNSYTPSSQASAGSLAMHCRMPANPSGIPTAASNARSMPVTTAPISAPTAHQWY